VICPLLKKKYLALFQRDDHRALGQLLTQINAVLSGFIRGHLLVALIVALISFLGLSILQVDFALLIGFTAGILDIVPYFGPIIGALPAVVIALLESPLKALYVIVLFFIIHQLESTIVSPKILGDRVGLHPLAVVFVLLAGGQLAGIVGVLLAVPVTAGFKICWDSWGMGPIKVDRQ
jgi:predicted PurR-regulated permease PerM